MNCRHGYRAMFCAWCEDQAELSKARLKIQQLESELTQVPTQPAQPVQSEQDTRQFSNLSNQTHGFSQPDREYDRGFSNGWNKCEERQATAQPAESDYVESLMTLVYDFARAYEHDKDGSYLVKGQKLEAEKKLRAAIAQPVQPEQEPVAWAWVWNPVNEAWERVHVFGYWQQGAIYAFGPTMPGAPQPEQNARK